MCRGTDEGHSRGRPRAILRLKGGRRPSRRKPPPEAEPSRSGSRPGGSLTRRAKGGLRVRDRRAFPEAIGITGCHPVTAMPLADYLPPGCSLPEASPDAGLAGTAAGGLCHIGTAPSYPDAFRTCPVSSPSHRMSVGTRDVPTSGEMRPVTRPAPRCGGLAATLPPQPRRAKLSGPDRAQASANRGEDPGSSSSWPGEAVRRGRQRTAPVAVGPPQEMMRPQLRGMRHPRRRHQFRQGVQGVAVEVRHPFGLVRHMDRALAQRILRRHAGGTFAGVAALRLDAAHREHEAARGVAPVGPQRQHPGHVEGRGDLAAGPDAHPVTQAHADQRVVHEGQPVAQRHADMVHELERGGAGAPLLPVDHDEIRGDPGRHHGLADRHEFPRVADAQLEAGGLAPRKIAHPRDEFQQARGRGKAGMRAGELQSCPIGTPRMAAISAVTLAAGSTPPWPAWRPGKASAPPCGSAGRPRPRRTWPDRRIRPSPARRNSPTPVPTQVPAKLAVIGRHAAFTGVVEEPARPGPLVQRPDRIGRQRPVGHGRDVEQAGRIVLRRARADGDAHPLMRDKGGGGDGMVQPFVLLLIDSNCVPKGRLSSSFLARW